MTFVEKLKSLISSYSELFFIRSFWPGLLVFSVTFFDPNAALSGLLAILAAYVFARLIGYKDLFFKYGFYIYNPLLVGFSIGHHFKLNVITAILVALSGIFTFGLTLVMAYVFHTLFRLPVLSIPFIVVSSLLYLASGSYSNLYVMHLKPSLQSWDWVTGPAWAVGFLKSLGSIIFLPHVGVGLVIAALLLWRSRILFSLAFMGFLSGSIIQGMFIGSIGKAFGDPNSFNYVLIAMGIGGVFLIPSIQSYSIAIIGVAIATILTNAVNTFWSLYGIPVFTLPFTVVTLTFAYGFSLMPYRLRPFVHKETPEETLEHFLSYKDRFATAITAALPFLDSWTVWQGFNGKWTHQGIWKYGYDFVKTVDGKTHEKDGSRLAHYFCFDKEVTAPVSGYVVNCVTHLEDNPIGSVDKQHQFGNFVTIYDARGLYVTVAHLMQYSPTVYIGQWVQAGHVIGKCGNSGYSPQPHIHMQMNYVLDPLSATAPFEYWGYTQSNQFFSHGLPVENKEVTPITYDPYYEQSSTFLFESKHVFECWEGKKKREDVTFNVGMAYDGTFYLERSGAKLFFGKWYGVWFVYSLEGKDPWLSMLYEAWSKMPLYYQKNLKWTDIVSLTSIHGGGIKRFVSQLVSPIIPKMTMLKANYHFTSPNHIEGKIGNKLFKTIFKTKIELDAVNQLTEVQINHIKLRKKKA